MNYAYDVGYPDFCVLSSRCHESENRFDKTLFERSTTLGTYHPTSKVKGLIIYSIYLIVILLRFPSFCVFSKVTVSGFWLSPSCQVDYYNAEVRYSCGDYQGFQIPEGGVELTQTFTCGWDGQWGPRDSLLTCSCT